MVYEKLTCDKIVTEFHLCKIIKAFLRRSAQNELRKSYKNTTKLRVDIL